MAPLYLARPIAKVPVSWVQFPKAVLILEMPPQTIPNPKSFSFEVWKGKKIIQPRVVSFLCLYFPYRQSWRKQRLEKMKVKAKY